MHSQLMLVPRWFLLIAMCNSESKSIPLADTGHCVQGRELPGLKTSFGLHLFVEISKNIFYQNKALISILCIGLDAMLNKNSHV